MKPYGIENLYYDELEEQEITIIVNEIIEGVIFGIVTKNKKELQLFNCEQCNRLLQFKIRYNMYVKVWETVVKPSEVRAGTIEGVDKIKIIKIQNNKSGIYYFCGENCYEEHKT